MDIRTMRSFIAIVQTGSITHAAEELHISQPALSRQVIELERELSCSLLDRGGRSATPTAEGRLLYNRARELVDLLEKASMHAAHCPGRQTPCSPGRCATPRCQSIPMRRTSCAAPIHSVVLTRVKLMFFPVS